ncbi:MAG TPA: VanZ family protein [Bacteroidia bacterium]|jgi:VanZ family protein
MFFSKLKWAFAWAVLIFILCSIPGHDLPHVSFLELLQFDKFVHAGIFFVLMLLLTRGFLLLDDLPLLKRNAKIFALVICVSYGGSLEIMQGAFFVDRTADIYDFIANSFGAGMAFICYGPLERKILSKFIQ